MMENKNEKTEAKPERNVREEIQEIPAQTPEEPVGAEAAEIRTLLESEKFRQYYGKLMQTLSSQIREYGNLLEKEAEHTVVNNILMRLKTADSTLEKLQRKKREITVDHMFTYINDLAGIRIVCLFLDDVYSIYEYVRRIPGIKIIKKKDFIRKPKTSGYQSLHLILQIQDLKFLGYPVKIELQIRTVAMNFWSVLEYQLQYKKRNKNAKLVKDQLRSFAANISEIDRNMLQIRNEIERI